MKINELIYKKCIEQCLARNGSSTHASLYSPQSRCASHRPPALPAMASVHSAYYPTMVHHLAWHFLSRRDSEWETGVDVEKWGYGFNTMSHSTPHTPGRWLDWGGPGGIWGKEAATLTSTHSEAHFFRASKPGTLHCFLSGRSCCHPFSGQGLWHHFHV